MNSQSITVTPSNLRYTLCFLTYQQQVLMLQRRNPPNLGLWNGVGGRIEPEETPLVCCLREVQEETGYKLVSARFAGLLTWRGFEIPNGGLYLFTAAVESPSFSPTAEGNLAWKPYQWVCSAPEVVSNIHIFAPYILNGAPPQVYHFNYHLGKIQEHTVHPLPDWLTAG